MMRFAGLVVAVYPQGCAWSYDRAVAWRAAERQDYLAEHKTALDVAFSLEQNQYNGETYLELSLSDIKGSLR